MDAQPFSRTQIQEAASAIRARSKISPRALIVTGSGLAALADALETEASLPYAEIPFFPVSTVQGHPGRLVLGRVASQPVAVMCGRVHFYEGYTMQHLTFPIRVLHALGAETLIVTNAAGGLNPAFRQGDIMLITDHINLVGMAGFNPLRGPNDPELGPRFPIMAGAYDAELRRLAHEVAQDLGFELREGVYIMVAGPTFETPADLRFLRAIGADAVGMSTVPEVSVARHAGMRVLGLSHISNVADPDVAEKTAPKTQPGESVHQEVLDAGQAAVPRMIALIKGILSRLK